MDNPDYTPIERKEQKSSSYISNKIAQDATLAAIIQAVTEVRPGNISRFHNFNGFRIENYLEYAVKINQPLIDIATRGIMVERGFIDFDETDLGWIISEAIAKQTKKGYSHYVGMLLMFAPIAAAAGFLSSSSNDPINLKPLKTTALEFIENTTPEDSDHIFTSLYNLNSNRYNFINSFSETLVEGKNYMLEEEINLSEFYGLFSKESLIFSEMHKEYNYIFNNGFNAFQEAIDNNASFTDAISHTFVNVLANHAPIIHNTEIDHKLPYQIKQEAINIMDNGGYITSTGKVLTGKLENFLLNYRVPVKLHEIAEITSAVTFIHLITQQSDLLKK